MSGPLDPNGLLSPAQLADEAKRIDNDRVDGDERKCGCCNFWFNVTEEGCDYDDELTGWRVMLCGDCQITDDGAVIALLDEIKPALAFGTDAFIEALKGRKP